MTDKVRITNPISIKSDATSRVAFDMMQWIAGYEASEERKDRDYWLKLYNQCYKAAGGASLKHVLNCEE